MKVKTTITISQESLDLANHWSRRFKNRSNFIEMAIRFYGAELARQEQNQRDLDILNRHADRLNHEALEVLAYQVAL